MRRYLIVLGMALSLLVTTPALAITFGQIDGNRHPTVGNIILRRDDGTLVRWCTGTMVSERVFLTAGHCVFLGELFYPGSDWGVTFMPDLGLDDADGVNYTEADLTWGSPHLHPDFDGHYGSTSKRIDIGVVVLDEDPGVGWSDLPNEGLLETLDLKSATFTAVGYGRVRTDKKTGQNAISDDGIRRFAVQTAAGLSAGWLKLSMNPSTGDAGSCNGDSGGPHFLGAGAAETSIVVSVTSHGDTYCRSTDWTARVDIPEVLDFIDLYID
jgi:trypsin